jgi:hypothetical protein
MLVEPRITCCNRCGRETQKLNNQDHCGSILDEMLRCVARDGLEK